MRRFFAILLSLLLLFFCAPVSFAAPEAPAALSGLTAGEDYVADELVFSAASQSEAESIAASYGGTLQSFSYGIGVMQLSASALPGALSASAATASELSPNYIRYPSEAAASSVPTDPYYSNQWHLPAIGADAAWDRGADGAGVLIAVLDSGVDPDHDDIAPNLVDAVNFCSHAVARGTSPTYPSIVLDNNGHGTHVSGIAAAAVNNYGTVGVAPKAGLLSVKVMDYGNSRSVYGYDSDIMRGVLYAAEQGADVINMSLGGSPYNSVFQTVINRVSAQGVIVVAATGNDGLGTIDYPAAYENVIAVSAVDENGSRCSFSNYGSNVDVAAPGRNIYSDYSRYSASQLIFRASNGTSMASPVVAGAAALLLSQSPTLLAKRDSSRVTFVESYLKKTADPLSAYGLGAGRVNARALIESLSGTEAPVLLIPEVSPKAVQLSWNAVAGASGYSVYRGASPASLSWYADVSAATTSYTDRGVAANRAYYYAIQPYIRSSAGTTYPARSNVRGCVARLMQPAPSIDSDYTAISLSWVASPDATGYSIYRGTSASGLSWYAAATDASYTDTRVQPGITYSYAVLAYLRDGSAAYYSPRSATRSAFLSRLSTPAPVFEAAYDRVDIAWDTISGATGYSIYRGTSPADLRWYAGTTDTSYADTAVAPNTAYYYGVLAYASGGGNTVYSARSAAQRVTTSLGTSALTLTPEYAAIRLEWSRPSGATGCSIYRGASANDLRWYAAGGTFYYLDTNVTPGVTYYYFVLPYRQSGSSTWYGTQSSTQSAAPLALSAPVLQTPATGSTGISLTWSTVSGADGYSVYRGTSASTLSWYAGTTTPAYTDRAAAAGTTYYYSILAWRRNEGVSAYSPQSNVESGRL